MSILALCLIVIVLILTFSMIFFTKKQPKNTPNKTNLQSTPAAPVNPQTIQTNQTRICSCGNIVAPDMIFCDKCGNRYVPQKQ